MDQVTWFCTKWDQVTWICKILDQVTCSAQFAQGQITWFLEFEGQVSWFRKIVDQVTCETKCEDQITYLDHNVCKSGPGYLVAQITWSRRKSGPDYLVAANWAQGARDGWAACLVRGCPPPRIVARKTRHQR